MVERTFFDWRNALPGFTFILIILGINYSSLLAIFQIHEIQATFGAILAFLTLVSGSSVGFLVSQIWWSSYRKQGAHYYYKKETRQPIKRLVEKYGLVPANDIKDREGIQNVLAIYSYILFNQQQKDPELVKYLIRRGDAFHAFSATRYALIYGSAIGLILRLYFQIFIFSWNPFEKLIPSMHDSAFAELVILILLVTITIYLVTVFGEAKDWTVTQYNKMAVALINKSGVPRCKLQEIFPKNEHYFDPKWKPDNG